MRIPSGDRVLSSLFLNDALRASTHWGRGLFRVVRVKRIGADHGLSGRIHRVTAETEKGDFLSFIVKQETAEAVERELLFRGECGKLVRGCIPTCFNGLTDSKTDRGVLFFEDIEPAEQGDVLRGCTDEQATTVLRVLARLHGGSWKGSDEGFSKSFPRWRARPMELDRWGDRVRRACERFPSILTHTRAARIRGLPEESALALDQLRAGAASWSHIDAHLDNVLWRADGAAVLLDWCNAAIAPPAVDLARFLSEGVEPTSRRALVETYVRMLQSSGAADATLAEVRSSLELALVPLLQSAVGWAGREDLEVRSRSGDVCMSWLRSLCDWVLAEDSGVQDGSKAF